MKQGSKQLGKAFIGLGLGLVWLIPFYLMLTNSFKTKQEIFTNPLNIPENFTFENYPEAFTQLDFLKTLMNSLIITVSSVVIIIIFSAMAAYALERVKSKLSIVIFMVFVAAMLVPFQSVMIPLITVFGKAQMLNQIGIVFMYLGFGGSMSIFLYHGAMKSIPRALDEAAIIDGASRWHLFWKVIFPMLKPTTVTVAVLNTMWIWNDYLLPSLVINSPTTQTIPLKMFFFFGQYTKQWHLALAGLVIAILPVIIFYFFMQKQIIKGVSDGAVK
ncbi:MULTISPECIES: carbohydrate ABC transporter permease [Enterococcus]|uniref:Sugar ABC transporter permease n=1 Tax=Enterococcus alcedinis TaxID=1274384 RepID=A0A917N4T9_9ENTE|nr:carbohydrate ABC transporter permease [Enterococcus alcedinis]MBP2102145.1 raffinose/stachyose/melibiose transport system permease protein [Enterococcus alcedinis]GGI65706.1 sugar ABC transporter permease [Enterococcus alcedinis]